VPVAQIPCAANRGKLLLAFILTCHADFSEVSQAGIRLDVSQMIMLLSETSVSLSYQIWALKNGISPWAKRVLQRSFLLNSG